MRDGYDLEVCKFPANRALNEIARSRVHITRARYALQVRAHHIGMWHWGQEISSIFFSYGKLTRCPQPT